MYANNPSWKMPLPSPQPQPPGSLKRPPLLSNGSSSSSLSGMEQAVPSFQSFISRTPPPDQHKPLPPTPLIPRRASSASPPRSRTPSSYGGGQRRSSSIYSRTVSQWFDDDSSWRSADLRDDPMPEMPPLPILQPVAYSKSTPLLVEKPAVPQPQQAVLEPRAYSPLIVSPSPTVSRVTTPNRSPTGSLAPRSGARGQQQQQQSSLLSTSPLLPDAPKKQVQTVSLEQAKAAVNSPGAVHLLPEELRAQTLGKSRSHEPIRVPTMKFFAAQTTPPELPAPPTLVDTQGRHRSLLGAGRSVDAGKEYPFPVIDGPRVPSPGIVHNRKESEMFATPLEKQSQEASKAKAAEALGLNAHDDEPRGRTRQRGPRSTDYSHNMPKGKRNSSSDQEANDAQKIASEYHHLLSEQYRQPSHSPGNTSDDSIRAHMKMVPQPLFKNKPAAKLPGSISGRNGSLGSNASSSPFHLRADGVGSNASASSQASVPLRLSLTPESTHRRTSTSGSIPISPPMNVQSISPAPSKMSSGSSGAGRKPRPRRRSSNERVSMYYPYVGSRKGKKAKGKKTSVKEERLAPPMPLLPAEIVAQKLKTPEGSNESSPLRNTPPTSVKSTRANTSSTRKDSNASSDPKRTPLFQRLAGNAAKYADLITRPSGMPEPHTYRSKAPDNATATPHSPHLLPSPVKSQPPPVHLGWSDTAKTTFDRARSSLQSNTAPSARPTPSPPRSPSRRPSIFGGLLDGWKERKKEERREELKKIIRVVPMGPPPSMQTRDIVRAGEPSPGIVRQVSLGPGVGAGGVEGKGQGRPVSGSGLGRRMSAFGWM